MVSRWEDTTFEKHPDPPRQVYDTDEVRVYEDKDPVIEGHLQFVPKDKSEDGITKPYSEALSYGNRLKLETIIDGYHLGLNWGKGTGQYVEWPHIHFIPKYSPQVEATKAQGNRPSDPGFYRYLKNR
mgnify:CR=1 FL=1